MISSQQQRMGVEVRRACQSGGRVWYKGPEAGGGLEHSRSKSQLD